MGMTATIKNDAFPRQGKCLRKRARVHFHYDTTVEHYGTVIRDDIEYPFVTIIHLDDGRVILSTECQYAPLL